MRVATPHMTAGWATFGLAVPQGVVTDSVQVGSDITQFDAKSRWPDRSVKFGIVTRKGLEGDPDIITAKASSGSFVPVWPTASVAFNIGATVWVASLPPFTPENPWLSGALVQEHRVIVAPMNGTTAHPLLQVIFDVRMFNDGQYRLDLCVQNVKDIPEADLVNYDVAILTPGNTWSQKGVTHWWGCRWRKTFYSDRFTLADVTPDFEPFYLANAFPRFMPTIGQGYYGQPDLDILGFANMTSFMMTPGGRAEIGCYPWWEAQYVVHKTPALRTMLIENGNHSGSWSMSVTEADGVSLIRLDKQPGYWLDGRAARGAGPKGPRNQDGSLRGIRPDPANPDQQHMPSVSFFPYLVTGDRFYVDQMKFWANWGMIATYPGPSESNGVDFGRMQSMGLLAQNGWRGFAWPLRELADCAAYTPDGDADKAYFVTALTNNLTWLEHYATTSDGGITESIFWEHNIAPSGDPPYAATTLWQAAYLAWAADRALQHGFTPGQSFVTRCERQQIKFLTSGAEGYPPEYGAPYDPRIGYIDPATNKPVLYKTMKDIWDANYDPAFNAKNHAKANTQQPWVGYYAPETRLMVIMGVRDNQPGALQALSFLTHFDNGAVLADVNARGGFAVRFVSGPAPSVPTVSVK